MYEKNKKQTAILLVLFVSMIALTIGAMNFQVISNDDNVNIDDGEILDDTPQISAPHAPIHIDNNWSAAEGAGICTGSGTMEDPWVIQNFQITCTTETYGIKIENSNEVFGIANCTIIDAASGGAFPDYGANIIIRNSTYFGIYNNTCDNGNQVNLFLDNCQYFEVQLNYLSNSVSQAGLFMLNCSSSKVFNNILDTNGGFGIQLANTNQTTFEGNVIFGGAGGIYQFGDYSNHQNTIEDNRISNVAVNGIYLKESHNNVIKRNKIADSGLGGNGIELLDCDDNEIVSNIISGCDIGINLNTVSTICDDNLIFKNYLLGNSVFNAYSSGTGNQWNYTFIGNYYDNHVGVDANDDGICENTYTVNGTEFPVDNFPIYGDPFHNGEALFINGTANTGNTSYYWHYQRAYTYMEDKDDEVLIFEDLVINGQNASNCIEIEGTNSYIGGTIFENCTVYNSTDTLFTGGFVLEDTENITIQNCNVSNNPYYGIYLRDNNTATTINNNIAKDCGNTGIMSSQSDYTEMIGNYLEGNFAAGAYFFQSDNGTFANNYVTSTNNYGLFAYNSHSLNAHSNLAEQNAYGFFIRNACSNITLWNNTVRDNTQKGIEIRDDCTDITIRNNTIYRMVGSQSTGIYIWDNCDNNKIYNNTVYNNSQNGIYLNQYCDDNQIYDNIIDDNTQRGIYLLWYSHNNTITNNNISNSQRGIQINQGGNNSLYKNVITSNSLYGLHLELCNSTILRGNIFEGSLGGINEVTNQYTKDIINIYNGTCSPISIDDNGGTADAYTWAEVVSWISWITGSGTENDPYTIRDLRIDAEGTGSGIFILDSLVSHSLIQNCTLYNSGSTTWDSGIRLDDTTNCLVIGNNCSNNQQHGILVMQGCDVIWIENNTVKNNVEQGIWIFRVDDSTILNNTIEDNDWGIYLYDCENNTIENNTVNAQARNIYVNWDCYNHSIIGNDISGGSYGIYLSSDSQYNNVTGNTISGCTSSGIYITDNSIKNNISENDIFSCSFDGLSMYSSPYNRIYDNSIGNPTGNAQNYGIDAEDCTNLTIYRNEFFNHVDNGIDLDNCDGSLIIGNDFYGNDQDIVDVNSDYTIIIMNRFNGINTPITIDDDGGTLNSTSWAEAAFYTPWITQNSPYTIQDLIVDAEDYKSGIIIVDSNELFTIENCTIYNAGPFLSENAGIYLDNTNNGMIRDNNCSNNNDHGIALFGSHNNTIQNNTVTNGFNIGIFLDTSHNNTILNNNVSSYTWGIALEDYCEFNKILNNTAWANGIGILLYESSNTTVSGNIARDNGNRGISLLDDSKDNEIFNNTASNIYTSNQRYGIYIVGSGGSEVEYNNIYDNVIVDNWDVAFYIGGWCNYNDIVNNTFRGSIYGIQFFPDCYNNTVINNTVIDSTYAIFVGASNENTTISSNTIITALFGIYLWEAEYVEISNNDMYDCGFQIGGTVIDSFLTHNITSDNTVNGKKLYFYRDQANLDADNFTNPGQIILFNCNDSIIENYDLSNCTVSVKLVNCINITVSNLTIKNNRYGINLDRDVKSCYISNNQVNDTYYSFLVQNNCDDNTFYNNTINGGYDSLYFDGGSDNNTIKNNTIQGNTHYGVYLSSSDLNNITGNNFTGTVQVSAMRGVYAYAGCENNTISYNIIDNTTNEGINIYRSAHWNMVFGNYITRCQTHGIRMRGGGSGTHNNSIFDNTILDCLDHGIYLYSDCDNNSIYGNTVRNNLDTGIRLETSCDGNNIYGNTIEWHGGYGIYLNPSDYNKIVGNTLRNNVINFYETGCIGNVYSMNIEGTYYTSILIDDDGGTAGALTWQQAETLSPWITGSGSYADPYIIEDLNVDGMDQSSCIQIFDSTAYVIIRNCSVYNAMNGVAINHAGIRIYNSQNIEIRNNTCSNNQGYGIIIEMNSENCTIIDCFASENDLSGIGVFDQCNYLLINNNSLKKNEYAGIRLQSGTYINISDNVANDNDDFGIILYNARNCTVTRNTASNDELINEQSTGIYLSGSSPNYGNNLTYNMVYDNVQSGIGMSSVYNCLVAYNIIENRRAQDQDYGVRIIGTSVNNIICGNNISDQSLYGIYCYGVDYNTIINNTIFNTGVQATDYGIYVRDGCINTTIYGNQIYNMRDYGIIISESSHNSSVTDNLIHDSSQSYMYITLDCEDPVVTRNTLWSSGLSSIFGNTDENEIYDNFLRDSEG